MAQLDSITEKIRADAAAEAQGIIDAAQAQAEAALQQNEKALREEAERELAYAKTRVAGLREQRLARARLEARDRVLAAKQSLVDTVLGKAEEALRALSDEALAALIEARLADHTPRPGDVLLLPEGRKLKLSLSLPQRPDPQLQVGFAIENAGVSEKYDFLENLHWQRETLGQMILSSLPQV